MVATLAVLGDLAGGFADALSPTNLALAAIGSFVAGTISIVLLTLVARPMADLAVRFQPADYFWLAVLAFVSVTALVGRSLIRGFSSLFIGLLIGCIGID